MKRTPKDFGLDVHQANTAAAVREETGRVIAWSLVPTEAMALVDFGRGMHGAVHVALEEGTQASGCTISSSPVVAEVVVCDRRGQSSHGSKAERAGTLYVYCALVH
jgi:hypothetical protein